MRIDPNPESNRQEYPQTTDAALFWYARSGDKDAFGLLVERHCVLARRMLSPTDVAEFHEQHRLVLAAVYEFSPRNQDAVLLFYYEQLSVHEIALLLGISALVQLSVIACVVCRREDLYTDFSLRLSKTE